jgi:hypothetical protein
LLCAHFARRWVIGYAGLNNHSRAFSYCQTRCAVLLSCFAYVLNFSLCFAGCCCEVVHYNYSGLIYFQSELTRCLMTWSPASPPASLYFFCFCFPCFVLLVHRPRSHHALLVCRIFTVLAFLSSSFLWYQHLSVYSIRTTRKLNIHTYRRTHSGAFSCESSCPHFAPV